MSDQHSHDHRICHAVTMPSSPPAAGAVSQMAQGLARIAGHHGVCIGALEPKLHSNMHVSKGVSVHQQMAHEGRRCALAGAQQEHTDMPVPQHRACMSSFLACSSVSRLCCRVSGRWAATMPMSASAARVRPTCASTPCLLASSTHGLHPQRPAKADCWRLLARWALHWASSVRLHSLDIETPPPAHLWCDRRRRALPQRPIVPVHAAHRR